MLVNPYIISSLPVTPCVTAIAAGGYHTVALKPDGTVVAWGYNEQGQTTGTPSTVPPYIATANPVTLNGQILSGVVAIAAGDAHTVALKSNGTVVAWGNNGYGQTTVPAGLSGVVAIAAGGFHTVALKSDGTVVRWGDFPLGVGWSGGLWGIVAIAAGSMVTIALRSDGTIAWAGDQNGEPSVYLTSVTAIAAGGWHSLVAKSDGTVVAWGNPENNEGSLIYSIVPDGLTGVIAVAAGYTHSLALTSNGTVVAWGLNHYGQCEVPGGVTEYIGGATPWIRVLRSEGLSNVVAISAGQYHSVALKSDGTVVAWGHGYFGQTTVPNNLC